MDRHARFSWWIAFCQAREAIEAREATEASHAKGLEQGTDIGAKSKPRYPKLNPGAKTL